MERKIDLVNTVMGAVCNEVQGHGGGKTFPGADYPFGMVQLSPGDRFLLCSDGITDMLSEGDIASLMLSSPSPAKIACSLRDAAMQNGGRDNLSLIPVIIK